MPSYAVGDRTIEVWLHLFLAPKSLLRAALVLGCCEVMVLWVLSWWLVCVAGCGGRMVLWLWWLAPRR